MKILKNKKGAATVEFALGGVVFFVFVFILISVMYWELAAYFVQDAASVAARYYAATKDLNYAKSAAYVPLKRWGFVFIDPDSVSVSVSVSQDKKNVTATVSASPRVQSFGIWKLDRITRQSTCVFEYRFRHPEEFLGS